MSLNSCRSIARLVPLVSHLLSPRRLDDEAAQRYHLGPLRLEAFVRRPDEKLAKEVAITVRELMPFLPRLLGLAEWPARRRDRLHGEETGGALLSLRREVEMPPFIICLVLRQKSASF